ncbi:MAG: hypothetical protein SCK28_11740, partial [Bacillota bacterium]|nr:hypothetical protein [Bacillota bacterium]
MKKTVALVVILAMVMSMFPGVTVAAESQSFTVEKTQHEAIKTIRPETNSKGFSSQAILPEVWIEPYDELVRTGDYFSVDVLFAGIDNLYGADLQLKFDPAVVKAVSQTNIDDPMADNGTGAVTRGFFANGSLSDADHISLETNTFNNIDGEIIFSDLFTGNDMPVNVPQTGEVYATIHFQAISDGIVNFAVTGSETEYNSGNGTVLIKLADPDANSINFNSYSSEVIVTDDLAGYVVEAGDNYPDIPISGATVTLKYLDGTVIGSTTTDEKGLYYFPSELLFINESSYLIDIEKVGYFINEDNLVDSLYQVYNFSLTPIGKFNIELFWHSPNGRDVDASVLVPATSSDQSQVVAWYNRGDKTGYPYTSYLNDDWGYEGFEEIVIFEDVPGIYKFAAYLSDELMPGTQFEANIYENGDFTRTFRMEVISQEGSTELAVNFYDGTELINTILLPDGADYWHAFSIEVDDLGNTVINPT